MDVKHCRRWAEVMPLVLVAEGLEPEGVLVLPEGTSEADALIRVIVDPIDGTRLLMYDKRSAWCLTGVAANRGPDTTLADIDIAMMSELPTTKQTLCDMLHAVRGCGAKAERQSLDGSHAEPLALRPSTETRLDHGFSAVTSFFPGTKLLAAELMETIASAVTDQDTTYAPLIFDDQYISTGGQLYELCVGHDRFLCDLRPLLFDLAGQPLRHCCHPYDICTMLIAEELGVIVTDGEGNALDAPLDVHTNVNWAGFANPALRARIEPVMLEWYDVRRRATECGASDAFGEKGTAS